MQGRVRRVAARAIDAAWCYRWSIAWSVCVFTTVGHDRDRAKMVRLIEMTVDQRNYVLDEAEDFPIMRGTYCGGLVPAS